MANDSQLLTILQRAGLSPTDADALLSRFVLAGPGQAATTVAAPAAQTSAASVGVPTKVEFDKTVADITALRTTLDALITSLKAAGVVA